MKSDLPPGAEPLIAERTRLENLLQSSEDWRALQQLRSRNTRGEDLSTVSAKNLEAMLVDALAENPFFGPYKSVCLAIERLAGAQQAKAAKPAAKADEGADNLTRIRGVDANLAGRLKALDITTFAEISEWRQADIQRVSTELGLGKQIYTQNWIEQAALLALTSPNKAPSKQPPKQAQTEVPAATPAPVQSAALAPSSGAPAAVGEMPEIDPNQLTLNFSGPRAPAPPPAQSKPAAPSIVTSPAVKPAAQPASQPVALAPVAAPVSKPAASIPVAPARPAGPPPKPLAPLQYGHASDADVAKPVESKTAEIKAPEAKAPSGVVGAPPVGSPPLPNAALEISAAGPLAVAPVTSGPQPPRPLVVTRASVEALRKASPAPQSPAAAAPPPAIPATAKVPPSAVGTADAGVPAMSISEALAYAAKVAREEKSAESAGAGPQAKTTAQPAVAPVTPSAGSAPSLRDALMQSAKPSASASPPQTPSAAVQAAAAAAAAATKSAALPSSAPASATPAAARPLPPPPVTPRAPVVPPPLPASFTAPEPPPPPARPVRIEHARPIEREDFSNRSNVEEASVEIVRRKAPAASSPTALEFAAAAAAAAAAPAKAASNASSPKPEPVAAQTGAKQNGASQPSLPEAGSAQANTAAPPKSEPRASPMGRFLKALTGN